MRKRLSLLVAATTSAVVLAFLIPFALLVRTLAEDRAISAAQVEAQTLGGIAVKVPDPPRLTRYVSSLVGDRPTGTTSLVLPDRTTIGPEIPRPDPYLTAALEGNSAVRLLDHSAVLYVPVIGPSGTVVVRTMIPETQLHQGVAGATATLGVLGLLLLLASMLAADRIARRTIRPIRNVADAADALRAGRLDTRVPERGPPEVVAMAGALNRLAGRIEQLLAAERDAVADLSHRLRTPVTALRLDSETIDDPEAAERLREHVAQLERVVDAVVHDARRPTHDGVGAWCDVSRVVSERVAYWSALADDQGRVLRLALPDRALYARLGAADLADVLDVLIDNGFAHTDEGVPLEVWVVRRADSMIVLSVEDGGPGLPPGDVVSRGHSGAGSTGLGLDIVRRAALASGGSLELGRSRLGGALIRVLLGAADG